MQHNTLEPDVSVIPTEMDSSDIFVAKNMVCPCSMGLPYDDTASPGTIFFFNLTYFALPRI